MNAKQKSNRVPFWTWNKPPARKASGKASFQQRVLSSLSGVPMYRRLEKHIAKLKREKIAREIYEQKFGVRPVHA